ncbi:MAG: ABC transporter permease [Chloroflexi bacterium]|nr:ABC transporter permease [Chloroflexota bacterium]
MLLPLVIANLKMLVRNRQALFWSLAFPLVFVAVFGLFDLDKPPSLDVGVIDRSSDAVSARIVTNLHQLDGVKTYMRTDEAEARDEVQTGDLKFLMILPPGLATAVEAGQPARVQMVYDQTSPIAALGLGTMQRFLDQVNLQLANAPSKLTLETQAVRSQKSNYFDFLLPGFVGMGCMTFSVIGLASALALYRQQNIFKRILATPLRVRTFFTGLVLSHLLVALFQAGIILAFGVWVLGGNVHGNIIYMAILVILGNTIFICIGFMVGAYTRTVAAASGLGNAVVLPIVFLAGTFFRVEDLPGVLPKVVKFLPLSPMLTAMRGVALDSKPLTDFGPEIGLMFLWIAILSIAAIKVFRFR